METADLSADVNVFWIWLPHEQLDGGRKKSITGLSYDFKALKPMWYFHCVFMEILKIYILKHLDEKKTMFCHF